MFPSLKISHGTYTFDGIRGHFEYWTLDQGQCLLMRLCYIVGMPFYTTHTKGEDRISPLSVRELIVNHVVSGADLAGSPPRLYGSMSAWDDMSAEEPLSEDPSSEDSSGARKDRHRRAIEDIYELDLWEYQVFDPDATEAPSSAAQLASFTSIVPQTETLSSIGTLTNGPAATPADTLTQAPADTLTQAPSDTLTQTPAETLTQTLTDMVSPTPTLTPTHTQTESGSLMDETTPEKKKSGSGTLSAVRPIVLGLLLLHLSGFLGLQC